MGIVVKGFAGALAVAVIGLAAHQGWAVARAKAATPGILSAIAADPGELRLTEMPPAWIAMILAVEDPGFRDHGGVDFRTPGQGMTTISQALVKQLYFERFEPGFAKLEQSLIAAFVLEEAMTKDQLLELFINRLYFGRMDDRQVHGFAAAARAIHGKPFAELTEDEFLSLLAMAPAPNALHPVAQAAANRDRVLRIKAMLAGRCAPTGLRDVWYEACPGA